MPRHRRTNTCRCVTFCGLNKEFLSLAIFARHPSLNSLWEATTTRITTTSASVNEILVFIHIPEPDDPRIFSVDGYNVGLSFEAIEGENVNDPNLPAQYNCGSPSCSPDVNTCPLELRMTDRTGRVSCASICAAVYKAEHREKHPVLQQIFNNREQRNLVWCECDCGPECGCSSPQSKRCCSPYNLPSPIELGGKCRVEDWPVASNGMRYDQVFKSQCPDAYSWQFDDHKSTICAETLIIE